MAEIARASHNAIYNIIGNCGNIIVRFYSVPIYIKIVGIQEYGIITFSLALVSLLSLLESGFGLTVNRIAAKKEGFFKQGLAVYEFLFWGLSLLAGFFTWLSIELLLNYFGSGVDLEIVENSKLIFITLVFIRLPLSFYNNILAGNERFGIIAIGRVILPIIELLVILLLAQYYVLSAEQIIKIQIIATVLYILTTRIYLQHLSLLITEFPNLHGWTIFKSNLKFTGSLITCNILSTIFLQIDKLYVLKNMGSDALATYSVATMIPMALLQLIYPVTSAYFPRFAKLKKSVHNQQYKKIYLKGFMVIFLVILVYSSVYIVFSKQILIFWLGTEFYEFKNLPEISQNCMFAFIFYSITCFPFTVYTAKGKLFIINLAHLVGVCIIVTGLFNLGANGNLIKVTKIFSLATFSLLLSSLFITYKIYRLNSVKQKVNLNL